MISKQKDAFKSIIQAYVDFLNNKMGKMEFSSEVEDFSTTLIPYPRSALLCTFFLEDMSKLLTWVNNNPDVEIDILSFRKGIHLFLNSPRKEYNLSVLDLLGTFKKEYDWVVCYERSLLFYVLAIRFNRFFLVKENKLISVSTHERVWMIFKLSMLSICLSSLHILLYPSLLFKKIFGKSAVG